MLKRENRLKKRYQYSYVYREGSHVSGKFLVLYFTPSKTKNIKVGFAVTKKIGHAIKRNKIRRRLREIVRNYLPNLKENCNIILVAKESSKEASFVSLADEFANLTKKANISIDEKSI